MKHISSLYLALFSLAAVLMVAPSRADIPIFEDKISLYGYIAGSGQQLWRGYAGEPTTSDSTLALDAAKLGLAFNFAPVSARVSFYAIGGDTWDDNDFHLLEANISCKVFDTSTITFGRFQSWIGYEAFDIPDQNFITPATTGYLGIIPTFHEGVKFESCFSGIRYGVAVVDSVYPTPGTPYRGSGDFNDGIGFEVYAKRTIKNFTGMVALGHQNTKRGYDTNNFMLVDPPDNCGAKDWVFDIIGEYKLPAAKAAFAAEFCHRTTKPKDEYVFLFTRFTTYFGMLTYKQGMSAKDTLYVRASAGRMTGKLGNIGNARTEKIIQYQKFSVAFNHALSKYCDLRAEASYTKYKSEFFGWWFLDDQEKETFLGAQIVLKF